MYHIDVILTLSAVGVQPSERRLERGQDGLLVDLVEAQRGVEQSLHHGLPAHVQLRLDSATDRDHSRKT